MRGFAFLTCLLLIATATAADRPNILFVLTDDQAPWAIGVEDPQAKTPHMDRLFREGVQLTNMFVVTPVCSPSRASLMTGRYGTELGITDWIHPKKEPDLGLDPKLAVWPRLLQQAGYKTGLIGKWHLGTKDEQHPTKFGFEYFMGHREGGWSPDNPTLEKDGKNTKFDGLTTDILADEVLEFLDKQRADPFLLCWHTRAPHARWLPVADEDWAPFENLDPKVPNPDYPDLDTKRVKRVTREYLASVRGVDRNLGRVLKKLDDLKLAENTIVIYSSDHGYSMGHNGIWHKGNGHWILTKPPAATENIPRNQRPNMYDNSLRVPTAVRWPGKIRPGWKLAQTTRNIDWFPTILEMAGIPSPIVRTLRGRSFLPLLLGGNSKDWSDDLFAQYSTHHQSLTDMRMYRTPEWKLIRDYRNPERHELYHLSADPAETTNLYGSDDPIAKTMTLVLDHRLKERMSEIGDTPPKPDAQK